jgi:iron(III) transport system substrate-binding protein
MIKRILVGIAIVLGLTIALRCPSFASLAELEQAARKEGEVTWYVSHYGAEPAAEIARAFTKIYPDVKVNVVRSTAQVAYQRLVQDIRANVAQCDVFSTTDIGQYETLKNQKHLARYQAENAAKIAPEFTAAIEPEGYWYPTSGILMVIGYNSDKVKAEDAPKRWRDLTDPKWLGKLAIGHPAFSGVAGVWALMITKLYGWEYFEQIQKNRPLVGRSMIDMVTMLNSGERSVAASLVGPTLDSASKGNPLAIVYPEEGTLIVDSPTAIMQNAPHPNAARLFMEFMLGIEHAKLVVSLPRYESVRPEVLPLPGGKRLSEIKLIRVSDKEVTDGIQKLIERWRDTFGN